MPLLTLGAREDAYRIPRGREVLAQLPTVGAYSKGEPGTADSTNASPIAMRRSPAETHGQRESQVRFAEFLHLVVPTNSIGLLRIPLVCCDRTEAD